MALGRVVVWVNTLEPGKPASLLTQIQQNPWFPKTRKLPQMAAGFSQNFTQLLEYNRDPAFHLAGFEQASQQDLTRLLEARAKAGLPEHYLGPLQFLLPHYARADQLAMHYQRRHIHLAAQLYGLAAVAVTVAVMQTLFWPSTKRLILLEILALLVAVVLHRTSHRALWHEKWLYYRHLAERFRTEMFASVTRKGTSPPAKRPPEPPEAPEQPEQPLPFYPGLRQLGRRRVRPGYPIASRINAERRRFAGRKAVCGGRLDYSPGGISC